MHGVDVIVAARFVFALAVLVLHFGRDWMLAVGFPNEIVTLVRAPYRMPFFFLTSGLLVGLALSRRLASGRLAWPTFVIGRVSRLYPLYLLALAWWIGMAVVILGAVRIGAAFRLWHWQDKRPAPGERAP